MASFHRIRKNKWTGHSDSMGKFKNTSEPTEYSPEKPPETNDKLWSMRKKVECILCDKEIVCHTRDTHEAHLLAHKNAMTLENSEIIPKSWINKS